MKLVNRRIKIVLIIMLMIVPAYIGAAYAQDLTTVHNRKIDLQPKRDFAINNVVNLANASADASGTNLEKDFVEFPHDEVGKFYGAYLHSSNFQFTYSRGGIFSFNATYNFTTQQVMNGVSTFWIRWPVDGLLFDQLCLRIKNFFAPSIFGGLLRDYERCVNLSGPPNVNLMANCADCGDKNVVFATTLGDETIISSTGIYTKEWSWLLPDRDYTFEFAGHLKNDNPPSVWVSIERYQEEVNTTYRLANYLTGVDHRETMSLYPAFDFLFMAGMGIGGLTSYLIPFDGTNRTYITMSFDGEMRCDDHMSIYLPFFGADVVTFRIHVNYTVDPPFPPILFQEWTQTAQNFLLTSTSNSLAPAPPCIDPDTFSNHAIVYISADKPIHLLGHVGRNTTLEDTKWALSLHSNALWGVAYGGPIGYMSGSSFSTTHVFSPFVSVDFTSGRWATITPDTYYTIYNFGWGTAYLFPGEVNLTMFLTNGTAIGYDSIGKISFGPGGSDNGGCQPFVNTTQLQGAAGHEILTPVADWVNGLVCMITSLVGNVIGTIENVFNTLWNGLVSLGKWLYDALFGIAQTIINVIMAIVDAAAQTAKTLLTAFPFVLILFIGAKGFTDIAETRIKKGFKKALKRGTHVVREARKKYKLGEKRGERIRKRREERRERREKREEERRKERESE